MWKNWELSAELDGNGISFSPTAYCGLSLLDAYVGSFQGNAKVLEGWIYLSVSCTPHALKHMCRVYFSKNLGGLIIAL